MGIILAIDPARLQIKNGFVICQTDDKKPLKKAQKIINKEYSRIRRAYILDIVPERGAPSAGPTPLTIDIAEDYEDRELVVLRVLEDRAHIIDSKQEDDQLSFILDAPGRYIVATRRKAVPIFFPFLLGALFCAVVSSFILITVVEPSIWTIFPHGPDKVFDFSAGGRLTVDRYSNVIRDKMAPGVQGDYTFWLDNRKNDYGIDYSLRFGEENFHNIPMVFRLRKDGKYIVGDKNTWCSFDELNHLGEKYLSYSDKAIYVVEWMWRDSDRDTAIGQTPGAQYVITTTVTGAAHGGS